MIVKKMFRKPYYVSEVNAPNGTIILFNPLNFKMAIVPRTLIMEYINSQVEGFYKLRNETLISNFFIKNEEELSEDELMLFYRKKIVDSDYLYLTIMPTEQCNFKCVYCYETFEKGKMKPDIVQAIVQYIAKEIVNFKGVIISWFGGEPLLAMDVIEYISEKVINICKDNKKSYYSNMTTNGYLLDLKVMERLYRCRVFDYQITLDGGKSTHDKQRILKNNKETFEVIVNNLKNIKHSFRKKFIRITLRTNLTNSILSESINDYLELIKDNFVNDNMFDLRFRVAWEPEKNNIDGMYIRSASEAFSYLYELLNNIQGLNFFSDFKGLTVGGGVCYAAKNNHYVIGSDGLIYKCTVNFQDKTNNVGYISDMGEFCFYPERLAFWMPSEKVDEKCRTCISKLLCLGLGCPYSVKNSGSCSAIIEQVSYILPIVAKEHENVLLIDSI